MRNNFDYKVTLTATDCYLQGLQQSVTDVTVNDIKNKVTVTATDRYLQGLQQSVTDVTVKTASR